MISAIVSVCMSGLFAVGLADADLGWELMATSAGDEMPRTCFSSQASLPASTLGSFFIGGPAIFEMGGIRFNSLFDGYGRLNKFEIREKEVCWASKTINSSYYQAAAKLGRIGPGVYFDDTTPERPRCPFLHPTCDLTAPMDNNWVNILPLRDNGLLITDSPKMLDFDFDTLEASGLHAWEDNPEHGVNPSWLKPMHQSAAGSAHPVPIPGSKSTYLTIMQEAGPSFYIDIYSIDVEVGKNRSLVARVPTPDGLFYMHSFGVTENYVVLPMNIKMGMPFDMKDKMRPYLLESFEGAWGGLEVVDQKTGRVTKFDTEKFFHVHIANTYENETGIVMDLGTSPDMPFSKSSPALITDKFLNKTCRDGKAGDGGGIVFERLHLHLSGPLKGNVTREVFTSPNRRVDFFKINNLYNGRKYCVYYATEWFHDDKAYASMAILQHNVCTGNRKYWHKPNMYPGEPFFIPGDSDGETDGHVIFVALDGERRASDLVILDGQTFEEVSVTNLPAHIPFLAHGQFFKDKMQQLNSGMKPDSIVV
eukprot:gnl/MRDRNA2_/MRDRNA2_37322_c0_seq1.p1 gnl/MRDRNA2_/MRDRNA2_37322_c0~~gnl/MRDRNA2_/MRDRNA2_37322_c0_seq1.p1  ORF type:complete len:535 (+),score=92.26 gnl/MRDRNA2_/MRDRNA2_37322_c0_seq1:86-1690(+)